MIAKSRCMMRAWQAYFGIVCYVSSAVAQTFTGVIQQRSFSVPYSLLVRISGELPANPTPEHEAYGLDPQKVLRMAAPEWFKAAKDAGEEINETTTTIQVGKTGLRVDMQSAAENASYILRPDKGVMWLVMPRDKKFIEMDFREAGKLVPKADAAGRPAEKPGASAAAATSSYRKTGESATINGIPCERYVLKNEEGFQELWLTTQFGDLRHVFEEVASTIAASVGQDPATIYDAEDRLPAGMPMLSKRLSPGTELEVDEVKSIHRETVAPEWFEIPVGYQKVSMVDLMKQRMRKEEQKEEQ